MVNLKIYKMTMTEKFSILANFVKDISSETKDLETFLLVKEKTEKKSHYEIVYATIIKINEEIKEKKDLEKIILRDVPNSIYPKLEKTFLDLLHNSGHPGIKLEKRVDFDKLYNERFN